jgi:hypothetical protein
LTTKNFSNSFGDALNEERPCLKIIIKEDDVEKWEITNEMTKVYAFEIYEQCMQIYLDHTNLACLLTHFENLIHGVCISNFDIVKGLEILFIFLEVNETSKNLLKNLPKIPVFETLEFQNDFLNKIMKAWNNLITFITNPKSLKSLTKNSKEINTFLIQFTDQSPKKASSIFKIASKYLSLSEKTTFKLSSMAKQIEDYMGNFNKRRTFIKKAAKLNKKLKGYDVSLFVHNLRMPLE